MDAENLEVPEHVIADIFPGLDVEIEHLEDAEVELEAQGESFDNPPQKRKKLTWTEVETFLGADASTRVESTLLSIVGDDWIKAVSNKQRRPKNGSLPLSQTPRVNNDGTVVKEYKCPLFSVICLLFRLAPLHACQPGILNDSIASLQTHLCEKKYKVLHFSDQTKTVLYETGQHSHATERDVSAVIKKEVRAKLDDLLCRSEKCGPEALRTSLIAHFGESYQDMPTLSQVRFI
jgi:hypothetical protein